MRFQNGCNKVVIELRVVQFWSEIILVISNRTRAARSFDFEITRMISDQIALHSVQLPLLIVSVTKFSIVYGSPRTYLSRNRRVITWVSSYRCLIWTFCNRTPVIGYPRDFHVNYARFSGFLSNVFYTFQNLGKALRTFSLKRSTSS